MFWNIWLDCFWNMMNMKDYKNTYSINCSTWKPNNRQTGEPIPTLSERPDTHNLSPYQIVYTDCWVNYFNIHANQELPPVKSTFYFLFKKALYIQISKQAKSIPKNLEENIVNHTAHLYELRWRFQLKLIGGSGIIIKKYYRS